MACQGAGGKTAGKKATISARTAGVYTAGKMAKLKQATAKQRAKITRKK